jgi:hypothetical protein
VFARAWSRISGKVGSGRQRSELLAGLRERVLEVGAGDGRNFALYPPEVSEAGAIVSAGFTVERMRRFTSGPGPLGVPFVLGTARRDSMHTAVP